MKRMHGSVNRSVTLPWNTFANMQRADLKAIHEGLGEATRTLREEMIAASDTAASGKWTPVQHVGHLVKSIEATTPAFKMPKLQLRLLFGKANRPSRTMDEVAGRYLERLAAFGPVKDNPFSPEDASTTNADKTILALETAVADLLKAAKKWKESDLDAYIMPHPMLGKVTAREMLLFTIYHIQHHTRSMKA